MSRFSHVRCFFVSFLILAVVCSAASAQDQPLKLAGVFGDHMVLQRDQEIPVWGWAVPGEEVKVTLGGQSSTAKADTTGKWQVRLAKQAAGGPHELVVEGNKTVKCSDVYIGEVWLCSGQSNMAWTVEKSQNFEEEKQLAGLPQIRMITINRVSKPTVQQDCGGSWQVASADTVGSFSASAWFFGRKLHKELGVPVGLINTSWGGTDIASWTSSEAQNKHDVLAAMMAKYDETAKKYDAAKAEESFKRSLKRWQEKKDAGEKVRRPRKQNDPMVNQNRPSNLFNSMVNPLVPYGIRGAIWYQGERNAKTIESGQLYADQLKLMITDWRTRWGQGDFPFITVQLPNFRAVQTQPVQNTGWVLLRESQMKSLEIPNTGLAITTDVGMANDIHPKNKQAVGKRLALWALGTTYGKDIVYSGPMLETFQYSPPADESTPGKCQITFSHVGKGLMTNDNAKFQGFAIAGEDQVFHTAKAFYNTKAGKLIVSSENVSTPVAVRYNWAENPIGNVVNSEGLPLAPFRTDSWNVE